MRQRPALAALAVVLLTACSSDKKSSSPEPPAFEGTTTTVPATPVVAKVVSPEMGSVQGSGGRGVLVVLTFTAKDAGALPPQFRLGGELPSPAASARPGHNPAFPGLVVGMTTTSAALGGPSANLANLFQIVSPALQPDGSMRVTAVWTNAQASFGSDTDVTLGVLTVSGTAPDVIPQPLTDMAINSNVASVVFRLAAAEGPAVGAASSTSTSTVRGSTTTSRPATSTTRRPTTTTTGAAATTTTARPATTTTLPPATTTTRFLGLF